jgi:hypothetical protein
MRNAYSVVWSPAVRITPIQILKAFPLAFMFVQKATFHQLPNLASHLCNHDDDEADVPIQMYRRESHPLWPALPERNRLIMFGGDSFSLISKRI